MARPALETFLEKKPIESFEEKKEIPVQKKGLLRKTGEFFAGSELGLGETFAGGISPRTEEFRGAQQSQEQMLEQMDALREEIMEKRKKGEDTTRLQQFAQSLLKTMPQGVGAILPEKTGKQVTGEVLGTAADIASFGTFGKAKAAIAGVKTIGEAIKIGAKQAIKEGVSFGGVYGVSEALKQDNDIGGIALQGIFGALVGGVTTGALGTLGARSQFLAPEKSKMFHEQAIKQYKRGLRIGTEKLEETSEKIIPELLNQNIWGLRKNLIEKAQKGIKMSMEEYEKLGQLTGLVESDAIFNKIEKELSDLTVRGEIISINASRYAALKGLRDDMQKLRIMQYGTPYMFQDELRTVAQQFGKILYESRKSQKTITDNATLSQVKLVDASIRELLNTNNPDYAKVNKMYHTMSELADILKATERKEGRARLPHWLGLYTLLSGVIGGVAGATGGIETSLISSISLMGLTSIAQSTWWNTMRAVHKENLAKKLIDMAPRERLRTIDLINRQGLKAIQQILGESTNVSTESNQ